MSDWKTPLKKALDVRKTLFEKESEKHTNCFRVLNGHREGIPGLVIEQYGTTLVMQVYEGECELVEGDLLAIAEKVMTERKAEATYKKVFVADRSQQVAGTDYYSEKPFLGEPTLERTCCFERGLSFEIQTHSGYSTGLFLDQRENRQYLAGLSQDKTILNLFAYTCAFSVACAKNGAQTTSVDLSKKYLEWGKRNFELNEIDWKSHQFVSQDSFEFLKKAQKKNQLYDGVIIDPPSFSRTKTGGVFSIKKDLEKLLQLACSVVAPKGYLFFSSNYSEWDSEKLKERSQKVLGQLGSWQWQNLPPLPQDVAQGRIPLSYWLVTKL